MKSCSMDWTNRSTVTSLFKSCETPLLARSRRSLMRFLARGLRPDRAISASYKSNETIECDSIESATDELTGLHLVAVRLEDERVRTGASAARGLASVGPRSVRWYFSRLDHLLDNGLGSFDAFVDESEVCLE